MLHASRLRSGRPLAAAAAVALLGLVHCQGEIGELGGDDNTGPGSPSAGSGSAPGLPGYEGPDGGPGQTGGGGKGGTPGETPPLDCTGPAKTGEAPLRRLTRAEYRRVVRDVFGVDTDVAAGFAPDERVGGVFASNNDVKIAAVQTQQFMQAAEEVGAALDVSKLVSCDPASGDEACATQFVEATGRLAYRRPLDGTEVAAYLDAFRALRAVDDFETSIRVLAQAMLQSPNFFYHLELDDSAAPGAVVRLPALALASRLSFLLWGSVPDGVLLDAALAGDLDTDAGVEEQAARLMKDARAKDAIAEFHSDWLGLYRLDDATRDPTLFPEFNRDLVGAMRGELGAFADYVIRSEDGDLRALLTTPVSFPSGPALALFGAGESTAASDGRYDLDPGKRSGILTEPAFLAAHSHSDQSSPILRGRALRERFFCQPLKDPPPGVIAKPPPLDPNLTTRERFAQHRTTGDACINCHGLIDDLGFALEHYDALGRYRETENGKAIDATGILKGTDVDGEMNGARSLAEKMSESDLAESCYARQWLRYALGRAEQTADACSVDRLERTLADGGSIRDLLVALATSDSFVNHRVETTDE